MGFELLTTTSLKLISPFNADNSGIVNAYIKKHAFACFNKILMIYDPRCYSSFRHISELNSQTKEDWTKLYGSDLIGRVRIDVVSDIQEQLDKNNFCQEKKSVNDEVIEAVSEAFDQLIAAATKEHEENAEEEKRKKKEDAVKVMAELEKRWVISVTKSKDLADTFYVHFVKFNFTFKIWICSRYNHIDLDGASIPISRDSDIYGCKYASMYKSEDEFKNALNDRLRELEATYLRSV